MRKILFITHDTSRSGAPLVLLAFMRWIKKNYPEIKIGLVALRKGHMFEDFNKVADKVYNIPGNTFYTRIRMKFISNRPFFSASFVRELKKENFDLVYANTVSSIPLGVAVKGTKLIAHIHELSTTMKILLPSFEDYDGFVNTYIAPSQMVAEKLVSDFSILPHKVKVIYEFSKKLQPRSHKPKGKVFKVGAAGTFHWRKGSDVFLQVARYVKDHYPEYDIQFIWIGKVPESEKLIAEADILKMGLQNKIKFTGLVENPENYYRELDVFLLPSREDPFPLVCIEVGMIGLPIICFENATGISEILNYGGGAIIPYLNIEKVSKQIIKYFENPEYLKEHGDKNKEQFSQLTPENKSPEIFSILKLVTEKNSAELL